MTLRDLGTYLHPILLEALDSRSLKPYQKEVLRISALGLVYSWFQASPNYNISDRSRLQMGCARWARKSFGNRAPLYSTVRSSPTTACQSIAEMLGSGLWTAPHIVGAGDLHGKKGVEAVEMAFYLMSRL